MEDNKEKINISDEEITRKEALIKVSKYAAFTAVGMMLILSPKESQAQSVPGSPGDRPF
jgi:hypothetical protein